MNQDELIKAIKVCCAKCDMFLSMYFDLSECDPKALGWETSSLIFSCLFTYFPDRRGTANLMQVYFQTFNGFNGIQDFSDTVHKYVDKALNYEKIVALDGVTEQQIFAMIFCNIIRHKTLTRWDEAARPFITENNPLIFGFIQREIMQVMNAFKAYLLNQ